MLSTTQFKYAGANNKLGHTAICAAETADILGSRKRMDHQMPVAVSVHLFFKSLLSVNAPSTCVCSQRRCEHSGITCEIKGKLDVKWLKSWLVHFTEQRHYYILSQNDNTLTEIFDKL